MATTDPIVADRPLPLPRGVIDAEGLTANAERLADVDARIRTRTAEVARLAVAMISRAVGEAEITLAARSKLASVVLDVLMHELGADDVRAIEAAIGGGC